MRRLLVVFLFVACKHAPTATAKVDASASAASCATTLASYDALVAGGGACSVDSDCECFAGGVSPKSACGGVTDRATAAKLESLRADYEHAQCDALSCAGWICSPKCVAGRCASEHPPTP